MAVWRRCEKSAFYRRAGLIGEFDKAYVDPIDLIMVRTIPEGDVIDVLRWQINTFSDGAFSGFNELEASMLTEWFQRVEAEMQDEPAEAWARRKRGLFDDLDVDAKVRDQLLSAIERCIIENREADNYFRMQRVPKNDEAVNGLLFHFGVGPCRPESE